MDFNEVIKNRRSVRSFQRKPIEREKINKILEAGLWAPSAGNTQEWRFIKIENESLKGKIAEIAGGQAFIAEAPVVIVLCADLKEIERAYGERGVRLYSLLDCGMAAQNLMLTATAEGLGACPVGAFDEETLKALLRLPDNLRPVLIIPMGYPAEKISQRSRKPLKEVIIERQ